MLPYPCGGVIHSQSFHYTSPTASLDSKSVPKATRQAPINPKAAHNLRWHRGWEDSPSLKTGTVGAGPSGSETNVAVWSPALPTAFNKARDATIFTRIGTRHSSQQLKEAFDANPDVDQTFCLSVNNVILVFSASPDEHTMHCRKVLQMLQDRSMFANINDCVFNAAKSIDVGVRLEQIGQHEVYMVINEGRPRAA